MSRVITVTQVHFQACKWFAICWLSYANVPCGVLTSWGKHNGCVVTQWGWNRDTRVCFFKWEELENFQRSDYHQLRLPVFEYLMNCGEAQTFIHHQSINERKLDVWMWLVFEGKGRRFPAWNCCFGLTRSVTPRYLHLLHLHLHLHPSSVQSELSVSSSQTVPCLISDTANVTRYQWARGAITQQLGVANFAVGGEKQSDYVIDIYLDRMKVL